MKLCVVAACLMALIVPASADNMQFHVKNNSGHLLQLRFFSESRAVWWPGEHSGWDQNNGTLVDYNLACNPGEKVCYAAWTMPDEKLQWGVGLDGKRYCSACCYTCGANTGQINLDP